MGQNSAEAEPYKENSIRALHQLLGSFLGRMMDSLMTVDSELGFGLQI